MGNIRNNMPEDLLANLYIIKKQAQHDCATFDETLDRASEPGDLPSHVIIAVGFLRGAAVASDCTVRELLDEHGLDPDGEPGDGP